MRIFLTGATGYLGSAALEAFVRAGHEVTALVRSRAQAERLEGREIRSVIGTIVEPSSWKRNAGGFDAYVHAAAEHSDRGPAADLASIDALIGACQPGAALVYTSGVWVLGPQHAPADETAALAPTPRVAWRPDHERRVLDAAHAGVRAVVLRPGIVYGGARGIVSDLFKDAANGLMRIIGTGENHWPLVHERDLGDLYLRLVTRPDAEGVFHANDEGDERVVDIVEAIAAVAPTRPEIRRMPLDEARARMGTYADALVLDQIVRSPRARALGWAPALRSAAGNASRLMEEWRRGQQADD